MSETTGQEAGISPRRGRRGTGKPRPRLRRPIMDRLMEKRRIEENGCWIWTGKLMTGTAAGYGRIHYDGKNTTVHRIAYELFVGPIPDGLQIDHHCENRSCFNPEHLEAVTSEVNTARGNSWAGINKRKTECKRGHEFNDENTGWRPRSMGRVGMTRFCKVCAKLYYHETYERAYALKKARRAAQKAAS